MHRSNIPLSANTDDCKCLRRKKESVLKDEHYTEMGKRVKAYRTQSRLTLEQAAERLDISVSSIKQFEQGNSLTLENLFRICLGYDCTIAEIIPLEFLEYISPYENMLINSSAKQREAMKNVMDRTEKWCRTIKR